MCDKSGWLCLITKRKLIMKCLRKSSKKKRKILEYFSDSVIIFIVFVLIELRMLSGLLIENFALEDYEMMERLVLEVCNQIGKEYLCSA